MRALRIVTYFAVAAVIGLYIVGLATRIDRLKWDLGVTVLFNCIPYVIGLVIDRKMNRPVLSACSSILLLNVDV